VEEGIEKKNVKEGDGRKYWMRKLNKYEYKWIKMIKKYIKILRRKVEKIKEKM
jgi:hypothetical protein